MSNVKYKNYQYNSSYRTIKYHNIQIKKLSLKKNMKFVTNIKGVRMLRKIRVPTKNNESTNKRGQRFCS